MNLRNACVKVCDSCSNARMVNRYVTKSEHDLFIDCLPYEWLSGTSDGLFLPISPPRGMHSSTLLRGIINFCNKYMSSL